MVQGCSRLKCNARMFWNILERSTCIETCRESLHKFTIFTDHKALIYFNRLKHVTGRLARWLLLLQQYSYDIVFVEGRKNFVADYLSREAIRNDLAPKLSNEDLLDFNFVVTTRSQKQQDPEKSFD
eukprot:Nk52_evm1s2050 gene=Nk52_evmTU1s2050